jgi:hypothetical protein
MPIIRYFANSSIITEAITPIFSDTLGELLQPLPKQLFQILPRLHMNELRVKIIAEFRSRANPPKPLDGFR